MKNVSIKYEDWTVVINNNLMTVEKSGEVREYDLPNWKTVEHNLEYIYITLPDDSLLQFKMEVDNGLIGDKFDSEGDFVDSIACHVFGENC